MKAYQNARKRKQKHIIIFDSKNILNNISRKLKKNIK